MPSDLPIDSDGKCMKCKSSPPEAENLICCTCATPWHVSCLVTPLENLTDAVNWTCPDCAGVDSGEIVSIGDRSELVEKIREIQKDDTIDDMEKARRMQALHSGDAQDKDVGAQDNRKKSCSGGVLDLLDKSFVCSICQQLPDRPVTTPCAHNFCLKCFEKSVSAATAAGMKPRCVNCREMISPKFYSLPKINLKIVSAIRMAKSARAALSGSSQIYHYVHDDMRPIKAYTTERAKKAGKANACSGQIFVTVAPDHFGPIPAENDPITNRGVLVGDSWDDRLDCRQWGAHLPHVAGIAGQSEYGAQSVALSGGYVDDEDHGEWFLYTGSGGRDLSGNKRTNKDQSFDQKFEKMNQALRLSCIKGYPVRVVRSFKEKRSSYAPESGVRYDGVYRIEKCWRKDGIQGFKVCRYLFVRCDNEPAPWTSDDHGDRPRPLPNIPELNGAIDVTERTESPSWDYNEERGWMWKKPPPASRKPLRNVDPIEQKAVRKVIKLAQNNSIMDKLLKEFSCLICNEVMTLALTTPCGHNFCKLCLLDSYADKSFVRERVSSGGRTLRAQKIVKKCPSCPTDISDFLQNPQVNRELNELIETLKRKSEEEKERIKQQLAEEETDMNSVEDTAEASHSAEETKLSTIQEENDTKADKIETEAMLDADEEKTETIKEEPGNKAQKRGRKKNHASVVPRKKMKEADAVKEDENTAHADSPSSPLNVAAAQDEELE